MTTTIEQEQWAAAINEGCDPLTLLAYADWLEERGLNEHRGWRAQIRDKRSPDTSLSRELCVWYCRPGAPDQVTDFEPSIANAILPITADTKDQGRSSAPSHWSFLHRTEFDARQAAARALCKMYPTPTEIPSP